MGHLLTSTSPSESFVGFTLQRKKSGQMRGACQVAARLVARTLQVIDSTFYYWFVAINRPQEDMKLLRFTVAVSEVRVKINMVIWDET